MTLLILKEPPADRKSYVTTTEGMSGHFAVILWWNPDMGGFWEPWNTGIGRYKTAPEAAQEAKEIAEMEGLGYLPAKGLVV